MKETTNNKAFMLGNLLVVPSQNLLQLAEPSLATHENSDETQSQKAKPLNRIQLQPKAMEVLAYLADHQDRVVSAQELMENLWSGRIVTPGSVQKSINAIRSAFHDLIGNQEVIVHYSKRGYQFQLIPQYLEKNDTQSVSPTTQNTHLNGSNLFHRNLFQISKLFWGVVFAVIIVILFAVIFYLKSTHLSIIKNHRTTFTSTDGYTLETGHERSATPHPDNQHVAYIKEKMSLQGEIESEIMIRNQGKDWHLSKSQGSWFKLAWSPLGNQLAAVEVKSQDGPPRKPNFYDKANYLYSFHIFTLDLANNQILEKQLLSQWQGRIYSLSWRDENTLEIVAKQGANGGNARYRYSTLTQQLNTLDEIEGVGTPLASVILNKKTALVSARQNGIQVDFLDEEQHSIATTRFDISSFDISWIPDGSGVLLFSDEEQKLISLYLDGTQTTIPLSVNKDKFASRPKFGPKGDLIYYTEEQRSSNIVELNVKSEKISITENTNLNYAASFSPQGNKIIYASVRNNQTHLWLIENGQEHQLTDAAIQQKIGNILWSTDESYILFGAADKIYTHEFKDSKTNILFQDKSKLEPITYSIPTSNLYLIKTISDIRNLWNIDLKTQQQKQLTFGSVGSAIAFGEDIYFQYVGETGLWVLRPSTQKLEQISTDLPVNSKVLYVDTKGVYFINGGICNESNIYFLSFETRLATSFLIRSNKFVSSSSFHPQKGVLQTECYLPEANIVVIK